MIDREKSENWIGFDLGGTKMLAKLFDANFQTVGKDRKKTRGFDGQDVVIQKIIKTIHGALTEAQITADQLDGIGIGVPGPVDQTTGVVLEAVNLTWDQVPLGDILRKEFGCPVVVSNDVDAGVYGEYCFGAARESRTTLGVFPGTGIGGGCVYDGQMVTGSGISCMEIGHMIMEPNGRQCGCGGRGCLETVASRLAVSAAAAQAAYRGEAPHLLETAGTDLVNIRSGVLAKAIDAGDKVVEEIVRQAALHLGIAIANFVHLFSPDVVVLGGGMVEAMPDLYVNAVFKSARKSVMSSYADAFQVVAAELGDDAAVMGAAAWARKLTQQSAKK
ncbi:MAG: ROK family protein [Pirellulaceae bacterium]|jgi:glucokinase|nr:ROK family protein [Pirellulaceae bacterium]MDP6719769.1 ROK family protein [Pirellulaceae bacterium]